MEMKRLVVDIEAPTEQKLETYAEEHGWTKAFVIRQLLEGLFSGRFGRELLPTRRTFVRRGLVIKRTSKTS